MPKSFYEIIRGVVLAALLTSSCSCCEAFQTALFLKPCAAATTSSRRGRNGYLHTTASSDNSNEKLAVSDYVKGVHGGKYQFEGATMSGMSFAGAEFADSLYSSGATIMQKQEAEEEELPKWAQCMRPPASMDLNHGILRAGESALVNNEERTWERFYAFVMSSSTNDAFSVSACPFDASPITGHLAPKGGATNVCDENDPYSDSARITVIMDKSKDVLVADEQWWLVVGTEETKWYYVLKQ